MSTFPQAADCDERTLVACLSGTALTSLQSILSPRFWFVAHNWTELDAHLATARARFALVDLVGDGKTDLVALERILQRHSRVPIVAYVAITPENLLAVARLSRCGLSDVFVRGLGDDYQRFSALVEHMCAKGLAHEFLDSLENGLAKLRPRLMRTVQKMFEQPECFQKAADIARDSGLSTKHLQRTFQAAHLGTPKRFLIAAKLIRAYSLLRDCPEPISEISARVGYSDARILSTLCVEIFGRPASRLRSNSATSEILQNVLDWISQPPIKARRINPTRAAASVKPSPDLATPATGGPAACDD